MKVLFWVGAAAVLAGLSVPPSLAGGDLGQPPVQVEDPAAKGAIVEQIMTEAEQRAGTPWDAAARQHLKQGLMARSLAELSAATGDERALESLMGARSLGNNVNDWVFTPVAAGSCRFLDTRPGSGLQGQGDGPLPPGTPFPYQARNMCSVPASARALSINVIAVGAGGNGNLRLWNFDSTLPSQPGTAVLTYTSGFNTSNGVVVPICNTSTATGGVCPFDFFVQTNLSATHVVADVFGYFAPPFRTALECGNIESTQTLAHTEIRTWNTLPCTDLLANSSLTGSSHSISAPTSGVWIHQAQAIGNANFTTCRIENLAGFTLNATCVSRCCRVPGR